MNVRSLKRKEKKKRRARGVRLTLELIRNLLYTKEYVLETYWISECKQEDDDSRPLHYYVIELNIYIYRAKTLATQDHCYIQ